MSQDHILHLEEPYRVAARTDSFFVPIFMLQFYNGVLWKDGPFYYKYEEAMSELRNRIKLGCKVQIDHNGRIAITESSGIT